MIPRFQDNLATLYHGDCVAVMAAMPEASVDAICTDPPYGLEFMGKEWDKLAVPKPGNLGGFSDGTEPSFERVRKYLPAMQEWHLGWAREAFRVLKPGGHLLAFGGSRTYHRLACAIEDAGFEVRDCLMWLYGCLTEDAEILTEHGWKKGVDVEVGQRVAQWHEGGISLAPVLDKTEAPYSGPMVRLVNHDTDQLLTPNHRVVHRAKERVQADRRSEWTAWRVRHAEDLLGWQPIRLPLAGIHDGDGIGGLDYAALLGWVWTEGGFDKAPSTGVRLYQSSVNTDKVAEIAGILDRLVPGHKRYDRERAYRGRTYTETTWFFTGEMAARIRADLPGKHPTYSLLWRMTLEEKREFWRAAMAGDGSGYHFFQKDRGDLEWAQTLLATMGQRARLTMRKNRPDGSLTVTPRAETELQHRHLARRHDNYSGRVWCVRVPSGVFVARRNGQVFVTGNSGFPKSLDVSKAIDKAAGAEREKVRVPAAEVRNPKATGGGRDGMAGATRPWIEQAMELGYHEKDGGEAVTDEARAWSGWGTALKPAHEPVILARKPLAERNVAANVLKHGTGALNVDGCRIGTSGGTGSVEGPNYKNQVYGRGMGGAPPVPLDAGRWPANVLLDEEAARLLDEQSGESRSGAHPGGGGIWTPSRDGVPVAPGYGDAGGASRFFYTAKADKDDRDGSRHPTVKPVDLMKWLVRLITPPGGVVLDPFLGSGTTVYAARELGFRAIGIEQDADYVDDAIYRLRQGVLL